MFSLAAGNFELLLALLLEFVFWKGACLWAGDLLERCKKMGLGSDSLFCGAVWGTVPLSAVPLTQELGPLSDGR